MSYKLKGDVDVARDLQAGRRVSAATAISVPDWVTGTDYIDGDLIADSDKVYFCSATHTSGANIAADIANWKEVGVDAGIYGGSGSTSGATTVDVTGGALTFSGTESVVEVNTRGVLNFGGLMPADTALYTMSDGNVNNRRITPDVDESSTHQVFIPTGTVDDMIILAPTSSGVLRSGCEVIIHVYNGDNAGARNVIFDSNYKGLGGVIADVGTEVLESVSLYVYKFRYDNVASNIWKMVSRSPVYPANTDIDDQSALGYMDIGGMRMQWGIASDGDSDLDVAVVFPVPFANNTYTVTASLGNGAVGEYAGTVRPDTTTQFLINRNDIYGGAIDWNWIAIGLKP